MKRNYHAPHQWLICTTAIIAELKFRAIQDSTPRFSSAIVGQVHRESTLCDELPPKSPYEVRVEAIMHPDY